MASPHVSDAQRRARLGRRHRLAASVRTDDVTTIAESLVAVHSTDPATVYLSLAARMTTSSLASITAALYEQRTLVRHHGMRRTLWVCTPETAGAMHGACTADIAAAQWQHLAKWVAGSGIDHPDEWLAEMRDTTLAAVRRLGPCTARQLGAAVPELTTKIEVVAGTSRQWQPVHTRLLLNLGFDGTLVRTVPTGSWVGGEYQWSATEDWLPTPFRHVEIRQGATTDDRATLVGLYLRAFGPATTTDVQWWTGWTMGATKAAIKACAAVEVTLEGAQTGWVLPDDAGTDGETTDDEPWTALLPSLDSTAMGWKHRDWYLGEWTTFGGPLFDRSGNVGPTVWVNGEVVGGWAQRRDGTVVFELLRPVDAATRSAIDNAAQQTQDVIGDARVNPRFPNPLLKSLVAG